MLARFARLASASWSPPPPSPEEQRLLAEEAVGARGRRALGTGGDADRTEPPRTTDQAALDKARHDGRLLDRHTAAHHLGIRDSDLAHLTRARWLLTAFHVRSGHQPRRAAPSVPLYRLDYLDALLAHPAIDWDTVQATPKGRASVLARLTTASQANPVSTGPDRTSPAGHP
ncbi:hypothetical protein [Streptomyces sp. NPDC048659]|uniref:hypothetical protein n=1 Tax=Streptomyces sp. NPDC048659 TaxID=3155489 RepID=UPI0034236342